MLSWYPQEQNKIQPRCKANCRLTWALILSFLKIWTCLKFLLIDFGMKWSRWRLCAGGRQLSWPSADAADEQIHLFLCIPTSLVFKPSGKLDILTLFTDTSEFWTIHGMFLLFFSTPELLYPQFTSEQDVSNAGFLFAFQKYFADLPWKADSCLLFSLWINLWELQR